MAGEPLTYTLFHQAKDRAETQYSCSHCPDLVRYSKLREHAQVKHGSLDITLNTAMVRRIHFSVVVDESWLSAELIFQCKFPGCGELVSSELLEPHAKAHQGQVITLDESTWRIDAHLHKRTPL